MRSVKMQRTDTNNNRRQSAVSFRILNGNRTRSGKHRGCNPKIERKNVVGKSITTCVSTISLHVQANNTSRGIHCPSTGFDGITPGGGSNRKRTISIIGERAGFEENARSICISKALRPAVTGIIIELRTTTAIKDRGNIACITLFCCL